MLEKILTTLDALPNLNHRAELREHFSALTENELHHFVEAVDEFSYSLGDWLEALDFFQTWLKQHQQQKPFFGQIEYLACCAQGVGAAQQDLTPLTEALKDYLNSFGLE